MLVGRDTERKALRRLLDEAVAGRSGALVLCGEAGIGKSALLSYAAGLTERGEPGEPAGVPWTVLRATGYEEEAGLAFASLHQLLRPVLDRAAALPPPQAEALHRALGSGAAAGGPGGPGGGDRFLLGLAVLSLLAEAAEAAPVLCLVDDAQWLDVPSAEALLFAARRLAAERVAVVFAAREGEFGAAGIESLRPARLAGGEARALLDALGVPAPARERVLAESDGNPLAMTEFADAVGQAPAVPGAPLSAPERVLAAYRAKVMALPERSRLIVQLAAAETQCPLPVLLAAAPALDVGLADLAEAEARGLVAVSGGKVGFRHPLIRTAAYLSAPTARRVLMHQALADAAEAKGGADCAVMHRAAAATGPNERAAAGLEAYAARAAASRVAASAAGVYAQAARLSPAPADRLRRLTAGAWAAVTAGQAELGARLAEEGEGVVGGDRSPSSSSRGYLMQAGELAYIRSFWLFEDDRPTQAARLLIEHAARTDAASGADPERVRMMRRTAATYAWSAGDLAALREAAAPLDGRTAMDRSVRGLAALAEGDFARGLPLVAELLDGEGLRGAGTHQRMHALSVASLLPDDTVLAYVEELIGEAREQGWIGRLPYLLHVLARQQIHAGLHRQARATAAEAATIARDTGLAVRIRRLDNLLARISAVEGEEERVRELVSTSLAADGNYAVTALSLLDLGLGRYEAAARRLAKARGAAGGHSAAMVFAAADEVEAAFRLGDPGRAEPAARRFAAWAAASGQPWARAVALRNEALLTGGSEPFEEAVRLHAAGDGRPFERARTSLLYGEQLRRARHKARAREQLRAALGVFERLDARPWAERARAELHAAGDVTVPAAPGEGSALLALTPQELQVVRLAAAGSSSRDIATRLFLSPRTVEYHLYKAYPKLGVGSRRELAGLEL
ncbi:AAA family ATPase [Streptomyces polyrhachis]|uniref:AAA family ATPase n=1 Tax=Streptomyces polyrhachis TaxID=1282885 RepID=A0ABW2GB77_9ACTN